MFRAFKSVSHCSKKYYKAIYYYIQLLFHNDKRNVIKLSLGLKPSLFRNLVRAVLTLSTVRNIMAAISFVPRFNLKNAASFNSVGDIEGQIKIRELKKEGCTCLK